MPPVSTLQPVFTSHMVWKAAKEISKVGFVFHVSFHEVNIFVYCSLAQDWIDKMELHLPS